MAGSAYSLVEATGNEIVDGLLFGAKWEGPITYAFPVSASSYAYNRETASDFAASTDMQKDAALFAMEQSFGPAANDGFSIEGFTDAVVDQGDAASAAIRTALSNMPRTAYTYLPGDYMEAGDVWFGQNGNNKVALAGNYAWQTVMHELGHAFGLKHGHAAANEFGVLPEKYDTLEYTIMTYRTYEGGGTNGYTYAHWSAPQTYMAADIAALQAMYGADFETNAEDTIYSWSPDSGDTLVNGEVGIDAGGRQIFATIWDGGGTDTYDLSKYRSSLSIDLTPGEASRFENEQLADLGGQHSAAGNIYNAFQYNGDVRSLIENAIGGSSNDAISGNVADNELIGKKGSDHISGFEGADTLLGGVGGDWIDGGADDDFLSGGGGADRMIGGEGNDLLSGGGGNDVFIFLPNCGADVVGDFNVSSDILSLVGCGFSNTGDALANTVEVDGDSVISFDDGSTITLEGVVSRDWDDISFRFV